MPNRPSSIERRLNAKLTSFATCGGCTLIARHRPVPDVRFGTLVAKDTALYGAFKYYKRDFSQRGDTYRRALAAILAFAYDEHGDDLARLLGGSPTIVAAVPSTRPPNAVNPLRSVVSNVASLRPLIDTPLVFTGVERRRHSVQPELFRAPQRLEQQRVLLIEDLWVRGSTAASAVEVIEAAGGRAVVLAIGREVRREFLTSEELLRVSGRPRWVPEP